MAQQAISNLVYEYARRLDSGDFEGVAELFRTGSIHTAQGTMEGYDAVLAMYRTSTRLYPDGTPRTMHITSNLQIEVSGLEACCQSYFTVMQGLEDFPLQPIISGRYEDLMQCENGAWRFHQRSIQPTLLGDLSRHLLFDQASLEQ